MGKNREIATTKVYTHAFSQVFNDIYFFLQHAKPVNAFPFPMRAHYWSDLEMGEK